MIVQCICCSTDSTPSRGDNGLETQLNFGVHSALPVILTPIAKGVNPLYALFILRVTRAYHELSFSN